ncbi:MAG: efflux RND transporter periplasmic adaptor subunit [Prevotellaceae bacterium]|jgi:HlyD family secretion protein|nr:efflux RND transporter periplasmic adaptor subunit [Prevotellaceae bacterium]
MKKWIVIIASIIVIVILLLTAKSKGWIGQEIRIKVSVEKVARRTITEAIPANGKIQPVTKVKISPDVSGEIVELHVKEGQVVERGMLLLKIKPEVYASALNRMEASLNSTQARLGQVQAQFANANANFDRTKRLYESKVVSDADYEQAMAEYNVSKKQLDAAQFDVKSAQAAVDEARENLNKTTVYAPMSGTIAALNVEKGERVVGTSQMAGTEMLTIADLDAMEALVDVNENDIVNVKINDTAIVEVDAYPGKSFRGVVTEVANSATSLTASADQVTNFQVKIFLLPDSYSHLKSELNPNPFRPGMSTSVNIQTKRRVEVLSIPLQAITTRSDVLPKADSLKNADKTSVREFVFAFAGDSVTVKPVTTGIQDNNFIEILSGLDENDEIVTQPYTAISKSLKKGTKVEVSISDKL